MTEKPFTNYDFIKDFYENVGFKNGYNYTDASYIARYLYWIKGYGEQKTKTELIKYCEKNDTNFHYENRIGDISKIVARIMKRKLSENKNITLTQKEMASIENIKDYKCQKILFSFLVEAKRSKFNDDAIKKRKDYLGYHIHIDVAHSVINKCGLKLSFSKSMDYLGSLVDFGLLEPKGEFINILFGNDDSKPIVEILGLEKPWDKFNEMNGGECFYCDNCKEKFLKILKRQKYCDNCKKIKQLENKRIKMKEYRNK